MPRFGRGNSFDRKMVLPSATDFFLGEKVGKTPLRGHPLKSPILRGLPNQLIFPIDRHTLEENIQRLPRSPATLSLLEHGTFASECLVRVCSAPKFAVRYVSGNYLQVWRPMVCGPAGAVCLDRSVGEV